MKVHLMYRDQDFDLTQELPPHNTELVHDLQLPPLFETMAQGDKTIARIVPKAILIGSTNLDTIQYRQEILKDCLRVEFVVRQLYDLAGETIERHRLDAWGRGLHSPSILLHSSVRILEMLVEMLRRLMTIVNLQSGNFESEGFKVLFSMLQEELDDEYFATLAKHLKLLQFKKGVQVSAQLGDGNKSVNYVLRKQPPPKGNWLTRMLEPKPPSYAYKIAPRDESGARSLSELRDKGVNLIGNALAQSTDHVVSFFCMLRTELAFYIGCLNLHTQIMAKGIAVCFPEPTPATAKTFSAMGLYNVCLALETKHTVVDNDVKADDKDLVIITGANQGGKSMLLRSIGLSQLMMQCGMFVSATSFEASVCKRLFTHFKREEDVTMKSGKFDEELSRMSSIIDDVKPHSMLLFNESFSSTNEREGSEIARQVVTALVDKGIKIFFVTHQFEFAHGFEGNVSPKVLFLRAERQADGMRTFKVKEAPPLRTSYGEDLYKRIFVDTDSA